MVTPLPINVILDYIQVPLQSQIYLWVLASDKPFLYSVVLLYCCTSYLISPKACLNLSLGRSVRKPEKCKHALLTFISGVMPVIYTVMDWVAS